MSFLDNVADNALYRLSDDDDDENGGELFLETQNIHRWNNNVTDPHGNRDDDEIAYFTVRSKN